MSQPVHPHHSQIFLYFVTCGGVGCCGVSSQWYQWWEELEQMVNYWSLFLLECWASSLLFSNITSWSNKEQNMCWASRPAGSAHKCAEYELGLQSAHFIRTIREICQIKTTPTDMVKCQKQDLRADKIQFICTRYKTTTISTWSNRDYYYCSFIITKWNARPARHLMVRSGQWRPRGW